LPVWDSERMVTPETSEAAFESFLAQLVQKLT